VGAAHLRRAAPAGSGLVAEPARLHLRRVRTIGAPSDLGRGFLGLRALALLGPAVFAPVIDALTVGPDVHPICAGICELVEHAARRTILLREPGRAC